MLPVIIPIPESATHATLGFHEESLKMGTTSVLCVSGVSIVHETTSKTCVAGPRTCL